YKRQYQNLVETQIQRGVDGIVPCGTTGESPTLSYEEHEEFIRKTVEIVNKRVLVIAGTGSNSTREALELTESACKDGVDAILSVNPYYNRPTQEGLYQHFWTIAEHSPVPIMLYNIPGRTGGNVLPETVFRLSQHPRILAIKEASGDLVQMTKILTLCDRKFQLLSGDDNLLLPVLSIGGSGIVSVLSNLFPKTIKQIVTNFQEGKLEESQKIFYKFFPIFQLSFQETNPIPIKMALEWAGLCSSEVRLPLTRLSNSENAERYKKLIFQLKDEGYE
ncbi:MAG: 4-hydroxy-tetrahydrodipicolinate synthase, partial [Leptospiraceae bacterium]|nr:4-hydroxy-tetrahydrodipicolinate synthase [Leptospiraceae bacterium]